MTNCPHCNVEVLMTSIENPRNGKWTALPLDVRPCRVPGHGSFNVDFDSMHNAVDIMGSDLGEFPVATYDQATGIYRAHPPSHYLQHEHPESEAS